MNIKHFLYKTGDLDAPESILDRNGEVVLDLCRLCGKGEADLGEFCDGSLQERLDAALSALDRMTDQRDQLAAQLKDATAQLARAGDLLNDVRDYLGGFESGGFMLLAVVNAVDEYLAGKLPEGR